ncbi:hypothetical protein ACFLT2_03540 [Acidobacteriota bacterium]
MDEMKRDISPPKRRRINSTAAVHSGFQCVFCGNYAANPNEYYSRLSSIILSRFIELLKSSKEKNHAEIALDFIHAVFGADNQAVRIELEGAGYLEQFEKRFRQRGSGYQGNGKYKCYKCGDVYEDLEITIDIISPYRTEFICEDCVSNKNNGGQENGTEQTKENPNSNLS